MPEQLFKLTPDRDLQCYFLTPSAIAAMSSASSTGFTLSGKWRQQFDWAVVEWTRDNVFEHPALRYLPDGDLSGLTLSYVEERNGVIPIESNLFPVVAWDQLRLWVPDGSGGETVFYVNVADQATPVAGSYIPASARMTLKASPGVGLRAGLAFFEEHYYYVVQAEDGLAEIARGIATAIEAFSQYFRASNDGASVVVTWNPRTISASTPKLAAANGNRISIYGFAQPPDPQSAPLDIWQEQTMFFSGGTFPTAYKVEFDFGNLRGKTDALPDDKTQPVPTSNVRKVRWTWQADLQPGEFKPTEFQVVVRGWTASGNKRIYKVAGPGSRRIEDDDLSARYAGAWSDSAVSLQAGNYSGSRIHLTSKPGDSCTIVYSETSAHELYLGTRLVSDGAHIRVSIDGAPANAIALALPGEDLLLRVPLGSIGAGTHSVTLTHADTNGQRFFFDFLEIAYPSTDLPDYDPQPQLALATDWDTYHSQSLPAERTAWLIQKLGFYGRVNHYVGAIWFYELVRTGTRYASLTVVLTPLPDDNPVVVLAIATTLAGLGDIKTKTLITHSVLPDDTSRNVAQALAGLINIGTNLVWASANGNQLTLTARAMGTLGNIDISKPGSTGVAVQLDASTRGYQLQAPSNVLSGGIDGIPYDLATDDTLNTTLIAAANYWKTDLSITPRLNRAARDWHRAFFLALKNYGLDAVAAFSTELTNGEPALSAGIAQRYPDGTPVVLNTPAIQTNFSPTALAYWKQVYLDMAAILASVGLTPYLQSGEVQWWYFPKMVIDSTGKPQPAGMTFYDDYTKQQFEAQYGAPLQVITTNKLTQSELAPYANEIAFLPTLIGNYTAAIRAALRTAFPDCRYEVLYPTDVNDFPLTRLINYASNDWTADKLTVLKTESFGFTGGYDLKSSTASMTTSADKGFLNTQRSHLVGLGDASASWMKEVDIAQSQGLESVVLFALDQYCLIGHPPAPFVKTIRSQHQG